MREIKFRQAIFRDGKFHHWHYWGYVGHNNEFVAPITIGQQSWNKTYEVKPSQQYTDLRCGPVSVGKRIYEGDIVRDFYGKVLRVDWANCWARYMLSYDGETCQYYLEDYHNNKTDHMSDTMEVIGNIYENKELLEVK